MIGESKDILEEIFDGSECCLLVRDNAIYVNILLRTGAPVSACATTSGIIDDLWIGFQYLGEDYDLNVSRINDVIIQVDAYCVRDRMTERHYIPIVAYTRLR